MLLPLLLAKKNTSFSGSGSAGSGFSGSGSSGSGFPGSGFPGCGFPGSGFPGSGFPGPLPSKYEKVYKDRSNDIKNSKIDNQNNESNRNNISV